MGIIRAQTASSSLANGIQVPPFVGRRIRAVGARCCVFRAAYGAHATYIQLLARVVAGQGMSDAFAENLALAVFIAILLCTAWTNWPRRRRFASRISME